MAEYHTVPSSCFERIRQLGWVASFLLFAACSDLGDDEKDFYRRAGQIEVGTTADELRRRLDVPSRVIDAEPVCHSPSGKKEWIYDSFVSNGVTKKLRDGAIVFCIGSDGKVAQILDVVR